MEPIRPVGRASDAPPPVAAVRRLTPPEREAAARERERKRRQRSRPQGTPPSDAPREGGGSLDVRA
jgi:hypothetical protein